jgi:hypothetical protein
VESPGSELYPLPRPRAAAAFLRRLGSSLEAALHMASSALPGPGGGPGGAPGGGGGGGRPPGRRQRVAALALVRALPMYGYHPEERPFVKIVM